VQRNSTAKTGLKIVGFSFDSDLVVTKGEYGARDHRYDVTAQLNALITNGKLHAYVGNQLAGDPCPNIPKNLIVRYRYRNQELEKTVEEGADLNLP